MSSVLPKFHGVARVDYPKAAQKAEMLLGSVVQMSRLGLNKLPCAKIKCPWNNFDDYTTKFWVESEYFWAFDKKGAIKEGDWVLIKPILSFDAPYKAIKPITHEVMKVVFPYGNIIDPITKRQAYNKEYLDEIEVKRQLLKEVVDEPMEEELLAFEERHELQSKKIKKLKEKDLIKDDDQS